MLPHYRIGIDIGGTFTDFVIFNPDSGEISTFKIPSTPADPSLAVLRGLENWFQHTPPGDAAIVHGSTVATNALLERKGAATALITTRGFKDVLEIGRQNRPSLYDLAYTPPQPLIPAALRFEVDERVNHQGLVLQPLQPASLAALSAALTQAGVESVAVCLLFSFLVNTHEKMIAEYLRQAGFSVSASYEILPEYREYERTSTTAVNAYVSPVLSGYLNALSSAVICRRALPAANVRVMQSNGGIMSLDEAGKQGVRCILSGPAGGIVGARYIAAAAASQPGSNLAHDQPAPLRLITFDMGGTSTDVSLIDQTPQITTEASVGGCPIRIPVLDIHTIGAGGGSIAEVDAGGALRVGPYSAGADPGPACYGRSLLPTVTDANLILGRIQPDFFLGGAMQLDPQRAWYALEILSARLNLGVIQTALGIVEIANAHMQRALRLISVERGYDPADFDLLSFGGAGGLHAVELARALGLRRIIVPPMASTLSALGMLAADILRDYSQTVMFTGAAAPQEIVAAFAPLESHARTDLISETPTEIRLIHTLDMRYRGQSYELMVPFSPAYLSQFHALHRQAFGYDRPDQPVEIVNLRLRAVINTPALPLPVFPAKPPDPRPAWIGNRQVYLGDTHSSIPCYRGEALQPGNIITSPALVLCNDTAVWLPSDCLCEVDCYKNLLIDIGYTQF